MLLLGLLGCLRNAGASEEAARLLVSAGPGCSPRSAGTCSLYLLELGPEPRARLLREASGGLGIIEAQASPSGARVVYLERLGSKSERLVVQELDGGARTTVVQRGPRERGPQWPDWLDEDQVVFSRHFNSALKPRDQDPSVYSVPARGGEPQLLFGGGPGASVCYSDVDVLEGQVVAQRSEPGGVGATPTVMGHDLRVLDAVGECHHPAWRPDGLALACFAHGDLQPLPLPRGGAARLRTLVLLGLDGSHSAAVELSAEGLQRSLGLTLRPRDIVNLKYPDWVDGDRLVATLYVEREGEVVSSQAVLVTLSTGAVMDLTPLLGEGLSAFTVSAL
jgi:hypothetical protein